ncbi:M56 family metallopeptidase [Plantactinospora soyae]|uniref:Zn-dependent protease with chaperone function n=1 Tax=Plantactinospora soyae TaxID=1544732 RepID=A0A927QZW0_9ACTN|nr:M56 family metallopeptidase [Plantactinospora soyae]MBE1489497.1 Zn-dependent protease with chaperone function [Plantactinospora soyae]
MFDHFVWSVVVVPPLIVLAMRLLADRLPPSGAAVTMAWSAVAVGVASMTNLTVFALKAIAEIPAVGRTFGWSGRVVADDTAYVSWVPWLSAALLGAALVSVVRRWRQHREALRLGQVALPDGSQLLVVSDPTAQAFAVPGRPGHIVVTTGMRQLLTDRQFDALLAHEHAHLAARHHRLIRLAELAAAMHPALWWVARQVDYLVERAADEQAAVEVGSRRSVAQAIGVAALAASGRPDTPYGLHAVSSGGVVPRRVAQLLNPQATVRSRLLRVLPVSLALASVIWTGEAIYDLCELLNAARPGR